MTQKYKIEVTYEPPAEPSEFHLCPDGHVESTEPLNLKEPVALLGDLHRICVWLQRNGGAKLEVTEEEA